MLSSLVKEHQGRQVARKEQQEVICSLWERVQSLVLPEISRGIEESGQNLNIIPQVKRKEALAAASSLTTALVDHLNVGVAQVSFQ